MTSGLGPSPGRPRDEGITLAITAAARRLLADEGVARISVERLATEAGVSKPAIYRRFSGKVEAIATAIAAGIKEELPTLEVPDLGDTEAELRAVWDNGLPLDGLPYVSMIGSLLAEERRHPELIQAFRQNVLLPRRELGARVVARGQERGDVKSDLDPVLVLDGLIGPYFARVFAGLDIGSQWRERAFKMWWDSIRVDRPTTTRKSRSTSRKSRSR